MSNQQVGTDDRVEHSDQWPQRIHSLVLPIREVTFRTSSYPRCRAARQVPVGRVRVDFMDRRQVTPEMAGFCSNAAVDRSGVGGPLHQVRAGPKGAGAGSS